MDALELSFILALMQVENGPKIGWNSKRKLWFPHKSPEGGTDTIGYGHKLPKPQNDPEMDVYYKGISDLNCLELFLGDYLAAKNTAKKSWEKHYSTPLLDKYAYILTDIVFNTGYVERDGKWRWPLLAECIITNDDQGVYHESLRKYTAPDGSKIPLTSRSITICRALGLKFLD